jgi:plasmid stability protein
MIQVRNVPEDLHRELVERARAARRHTEGGVLP